jgi:hypothetical protein
VARQRLSFESRRPEPEKEEEEEEKEKQRIEEERKREEEMEEIARKEKFQQAQKLFANES